MITVVSVIVTVGITLCCAYVAVFVIGAIALCFTAGKETEVMQRRVDEAISRHPAGSCWRPDMDIRPGADSEPHSCRSLCGHLIYGNSEIELPMNEITHSSQCQLPRREDAA